MIITILSISLALILFFSIPKFRASAYDYKGFANKTIQKALRGELKASHIEQIRQGIESDAVNKANKSITAV